MGRTGILRAPGFLWLTGAQAMSQIGDQLGYVALIALVYQQSSRAGAIGLLLILQAIPGLALGLVAGGLVDRTASKRRIMIGSDLLQAVLTAGLVLAEAPWQLYLLAAGKALVATFFFPAKNAIIRQMLAGEQLREGIALSAAVGQTIQIAGPTLAGLFIALGDLRIAFAADAVSFVVSALLCLGLPAGPGLSRAPSGARQESFWHDLLGGLRAFGRNPALRALGWMELTALLGVGAVNVLLVAYVVQALGLQASQFGFLLTFLGAGLLIGSLLAGPLGRRLTTMALAAWSLVGIGLLVTVAGVLKGLLLAIPVFVLIGVGNGIFNVASTTVLQEHTPPELTGRIFGLIGTAQNTVALLSMALGGWLADWLRVGTVFILAGTVIGLGGLLGLGSIRTTILERMTGHGRQAGQEGAKAAEGD